MAEGGDDGTAGGPEAPGIVTREVPGCGVAAFAARAFRAGEVVLEETALLTSALGAPAKGGAPARQLWEALLREERSRRLPAFEPAAHLGALAARSGPWVRPVAGSACWPSRCVGPEQALPSPADARREAVVLRAAAREGLLPQGVIGAFSAEEYARLRRVIQLNGFRFNGALREGESGYDVGEAIFDKVSRINHSCDPNLVFDLSWNEAEEVVQIRVEAARDVAEGEEVNISYLPQKVRESLPPSERRRQLREHWLFDCGCPRCQADAGSAEEATQTDPSPPAAAHQAAVAAQGAPGAASPSQPRRATSASSSSSSSQGVCWDDLADPSGAG